MQRCLAVDQVPRGTNALQSFWIWVLPAPQAVLRFASQRFRHTGQARTQDSFLPPVRAPAPRPKALIVAAAVAASNARVEGEITEVAAVEPEVSGDSTTETVRASIEAAIFDAVASAEPAKPVYVEPEPPQTRQFAAVPEEQPEVVTRLSTSGNRMWGINVGSFTTRYQAERVLLKVALKELGTLDEALRKVAPKSGKYDANFVGMSEDKAGARLSSVAGAEYPLRAARTQLIRASGDRRSRATECDANPLRDHRTAVFSPSR